MIHYLSLNIYYFTIIGNEKEVQHVVKGSGNCIIGRGGLCNAIGASIARELKACMRFVGLHHSPIVTPLKVTLRVYIAYVFECLL